LIAAGIAWAIVCTVIALAFSISISTWLIAIAGGVLPPLVILRMWRPLAPVRIGAARR
jgi:hypothetical protein